MAGVGMLHVVAALITSHADGSAPVYSPGFSVGPGVAADITFQTADNPDMGDDVVIDNDNGVTGYTGTMENNYIEEEVAAKLYGWKQSGSGSSVEYVITDAPSPYLGFGYLKKCLDNGVVKYRAFWYLKAQIQIGSYMNGRTKPRNGVEWQHDTSNITGHGAIVDATGEIHFVIPKTFTTRAAAEAWLDDKAGIQAATT